MQKLLPLVTLLFLLVVTPVIASQNNSSNGECDPNAEWKNHGQYVSCVAHTHPGGQVVSQAAQSDVGKKNIVSVSPSPLASPIVSPSPEVSPSPSPEVSPSPSPEVSPSPSPEVSPSPSPEVSPSPSPEVSPSPSPSPEGETTEATNDILAQILAKLGEIINQLANLL